MDPQHDRGISQSSIATKWYRFAPKVPMWEFCSGQYSFTSNGQKISLPLGTTMLMMMMMGGTKLAPATDLEMNLTAIKTTAVMMEIR